MGFEVRAAGSTTAPSKSREHRHHLDLNPRLAFATNHDRLSDVGVPCRAIEATDEQGDTLGGSPAVGVPAVPVADSAFTGSIPALYERYLGPLLFEPYARDLISRFADMQSGRLLETAAGTGIVTRALASTLPADVEIVATDLNQSMVDFATAQQRASNVTWQQADALRLSCADQTFDAVVCQFGLMFLPDKQTGYREAHRVLKSGGRFVFSVWERIEENEFAHTVSAAVAALFPNDPPTFLARIPYGFHDTDTISTDLRQAGFSRVAIESVELRSRSASSWEPAIGFCQGTPLRSEIEARSASLLEEATATAERALASRFGSQEADGKVRAYVMDAVR
ncbi:class I SAM-dependent methyltransferase [Methylobacterium phyllosphaerae]